MVLRKASALRVHDRIEYLGQTFSVHDIIKLTDFDTYILKDLAGKAFLTSLTSEDVVEVHLVMVQVPA